MQDEYDFSRPEFGQPKTGKFYRPEQPVTLPVHLDADIQDFFAKRALERGVEMSDLINDALRREIKQVAAAE